MCSGPKINPFISLWKHWTFKDKWANSSEVSTPFLVHSLMPSLTTSQESCPYPSYPLPPVILGDHLFVASGSPCSQESTSGLVSTGTETAPGFPERVVIQSQMERALLQSLQIRTFMKFKVNYQRCEMSAREGMLNPAWIFGDKVSFALLLFNYHHSEPRPFSFCIRTPTQRISAHYLIPHTNLC